MEGGATPCMNSDTPPIPTPRHPLAWITFDRISVVLMALVLLTIPVALALIWLTSNPNDRRTLDQFVPTAPGTTLVYQVIAPDGSEQYQSSNIGRASGNDALANINNIEATSEIMQRLTGSTELSEAQVERVLETAADTITAARLIETTYTATETIRTATSFFLIHDNQAELINIDNVNFLPFVPFYDGTLTQGESLHSSGIYGIGSPYSATLTFEAEEGVETPLKNFDNCQRFLLTVDITDTLYTQLRSWFCEGVGLALQETTYNHAESPTRSLLIAAHTPAESQNAPLPPLSPAISEPSPPAVELGTEWERLWSFNDGERQRRDISTQIITVGNLYLFGDEEGHLLAIDRATHRIAWRFQTGASLYATPVVANGIVYVASSEGVLYALDVRNGAFRWAFRVRDILSATPAIANGKVYIGAEDSTFYALDAQTGVEQWRYNMGGPIASTPVINDGVLYVGADDGGLYALDAATGEAQWIFPSDSGINGSVAIANGIIYMGNVDGWVYALNGATTRAQGEVLWAYESEYSIVNDLVMNDGLLYVTAANTLIALDGQSGAEVWRFNAEFALSGAPLLLSNYLFANLGLRVAILDPQSGEVVSEITGISPESNTPLGSDGDNLLIGHIDGMMSVFNSRATHPWQSEAAWVATDLNNRLIDLFDALSTPPLAMGEDLLYVSTYGRIFRVSRNDGSSTLLGETELNLAYLPPVLVNNTLIAGTFFGELAAFNLETNTVQWRVDLENATYTSLYSDGERLLWSATIGNELVAYAFDPATGETLWEQPLPYAFAATPNSILHNGVYYVVGDFLSALDPATGEILWQSTEPYRPLFLTALDNQVYAMTVTDTFETVLVGWDTASHDIATLIPYSTDALPAIFGGMASGNGLVLLVSENGFFTAFDIATQSIRWQADNGRGVQGIPVITPDTLLYVAADNHLHARSLTDGSLVGDFASPRTSFTPADVDGSMAPLLLEGRLYAAAYQEAYALSLRQRSP